MVCEQRVAPFDYFSRRVVVTIDCPPNLALIIAPSNLSDVGKKSFELVLVSEPQCIRPSSSYGLYLADEVVVTTV